MVVRQHHAAVQRACDAGAYFPDFDQVARSLNVDPATTHMTYHRDGNVWTFTPDARERIIKLPLVLRLENGDSITLRSPGNVFNTGTRKFVASSGCRCETGKDAGKAGEFCYTCAAMPLTMVDRADGTSLSVADAGYGGSQRNLATDLGLAALFTTAVGLEPFIALGRPNIDQNKAAPAGLKGNKVLTPARGPDDWSMMFSCTFPGNGATTTDGTQLCGAGTILLAKKNVSDKLFVVPFGAHRHTGSPCIAHQTLGCGNCASLRPLPLPPATSCTGVHGAVLLQSARDCIARTAGPARDSVSQLTGQIALSASAMLKLNNNTQRVPQDRNVEELVARSSDRRYLAAGMPLGPNGSLPHPSKAHCLDELVRLRQMQSICLRSPLGGSLCHSTELTRCTPLSLSLLSAFHM